MWPVRRRLPVDQQFMLALLVVLLTIIVVTAIESFQLRHRPRGLRESSKNNLKQIGFALHNYHDVHRTFPAAYIADERGRPMHSWRVFALPFLEHANVYDRYDFNEPWNGPHNKELIDEDIPQYRWPSKESDGKPTRYVAVVGLETCWPDGGSISIADVTDGTSHTALVVECRDLDIAWSEPRDLIYNQLPLRINPNQGQPVPGPPGISSEERGALVLMADGAVRFLSDKTDEQTLEQILERADGQPLMAP